MKPKARSAFTAALALALLPACAVDAGDASEPLLTEAGHEVVGIPAVAGETPRGVYVMGDKAAVEPFFTPGFLAAPRHRVIYMNKNGGTYTPGYNDSTTNRSSIPNYTSTISPWNVSSTGWQQVMTCMRDLWSPFDVEITDVDPGNVDHIESVVAGSPQDVGMSSGVGGVSPFDCGIIERSIVFTFAEVYGSSYRAICETAAQEVAHSFGLDHEYLCADPMTYLGGCGQKSFQDVNASCGEYSARSCNCGGSTQNSVQMLLDANGPADAIAPVVNITQPADGATVEPGFQVSASATDNLVVTSVTLLVDGVEVATLNAAPWAFTTDLGLADGNHAIAVRASDGKNVATDDISVVVETAEDPTDPNDPSDPVDPIDPNDPVDPNDPNDPNDPGGGNEDITGGCAAGGQGASTGLLLVAGLLLVVRRRRTGAVASR